MSEDQAGRCNGKCGSGAYVGKGRYVCTHDNILALHPDVCLEWDHDQNEDTPDKYSSGSGKYAWWICRKGSCDCHRWRAKINDRVSRSTGCPFCLKGKACPHNNLLALYPDLCLEWDVERNNQSPSQYSPKSGRVVWWKCNKGFCDCHRWQAKIYHRTGSTSGCPFCSRGKLCPHNNLLALYPDLCLEWDHDRNEDGGPDKYAPGSHKCVWWICRKGSCDCHRWKTGIKDRIQEGSGCPFCHSGKTCPHNNLLALYPDLCREWNHGKNLAAPETYAPHSGLKVWWMCLDGHEWSAGIYSRTNGSGCPHCTRKRKYSKQQIKWLESIMKEQNLSIQYALSPEGEYRIPTIGKVDGYCSKNNVVYEYHGDFWHGNPLVFKEDDVNTIIHKTFGQLYRDTLSRDDRIRKLGYDLVVQWETNLE